MSKLTITAKGQVTLRRDLLEHLGVGPGQRISVEKLPDGKIEVRAAPKGDIRAVFGLLRNKTRVVLSIEEMNEIARQGWAGTPARKR
jgi:bifunctional DNA-binding transcriptional regulator/antitoxin component of YhaV-PrlF toxin-antitoxin module